MTVLKRLLGLKLRVSGTENIDNRTTLFVANHFTRVETFLIPHVIYEYAGRQVRSLGTHSVFKGLFGRYFEALGGASPTGSSIRRGASSRTRSWSTAAG
jgi:1-acyl-sn-glycerol-3-phosphate acyltransferase